MAKLPTSTLDKTDDTGNTQKKEFKVIPENAILNVTVEKCELRDLPEDFRKAYNVEDTQEVSFSFRVQDGEFEKRMLWGSAKPYWSDSDGCRLRIWTQEIMGVDKLDDGYEFDTENVEGKSCRILVKQRQKKDGTKSNKVAEVMRSINASNEYSLEDEPF